MAVQLRRFIEIDVKVDIRDGPNGQMAVPQIRTAKLSLDGDKVMLELPSSMANSNVIFTSDDLFSAVYLLKGEKNGEEWHG